MALDPVRNFTVISVSQGYAAGVTTIILAAGEGAKLPDPAIEGAFNLVWWDGTFLNPSTDPYKEIIRCTARVGDILTIIRAQEGTADVNHNISGRPYRIILTITKKIIDDIRQGYVPYSGAIAPVDLGAQNISSTGTIGGVNVTSGSDPGHTHTAYDLAGAAATVQGNLNTHVALSTTAHGGIVASTDPRLSDARTPVAHQLDLGTYHTVSGLTSGHFLKATSPTTFGFAAHGLGYADVGAEPVGAAAAAVGAHQTTYNHANYDTAYGWGPHAGLYAPIGHKTTEDALNGLVSVDGAGGYSAKVIGTHVQAFHANLASLSGLGYVSASFVKMTGAGTFTLDTSTYSLSSHNHAGVYDPAGTGNAEATAHVAAHAGEADPHSVYMLMLGRSGGQSPIGGTGSGDNLLFESTSDGTKGKVGVKDLGFYINADYSSGDYDAVLDFNNGMAQIKCEYLGTAAGENVRLVSLGERWHVSKTFNTGAADFDTGDIAWVQKTRAVYDYATWALGTKYGVANFVTLDNILNNTSPELAAFDAFVYSVYANSKAGVIGFDANMIKASPCITNNNFMGFSSVLMSSVDPSSAIYGGGYVAAAVASLSSYSGGIRQYSAFCSRGDVGWKYPYLSYDTDNATVLFYADQYGRIYAKDAIGVGNTPSASYSFYGYKIATDTATRTAFMGVEVQKVTADGTYTAYGINLGIYTAIASGKTNSGSIRGSQQTVFRAAVSTEIDSGILANLYNGIWYFGHTNSSVASNPITTTVYGLLLSPYIYRGTITNLYSLYLNAPTALSTPSDWAHGDYVAGDLRKPTVSTGYWYVCTQAGHSGDAEPSPWNTTPGGTTNDGTVVWTTLIIPSITNLWGVYQASSVAKNYFNGMIGIGGTPSYDVHIQRSSGNLAAYMAGSGTSQSAQYFARGRTGAPANVDMIFGTDVSGTGAGQIGMITNHPMYFMTNSTVRIYVDASGVVSIGPAAPAISDGIGLHIQGKILRLGTSKTPVSAGDTGNQGEICWDASYIYVCTAANTWKRIAIATW